MSEVDFAICRQCKYHPACRDLELDGVFVGDDRKCIEKVSVEVSGKVFSQIQGFEFYLIDETGSIVFDFANLLNFLNGRKVKITIEVEKHDEVNKL